jgi:nicotinamide phosphoribosyltransferase
MGSTLRFEDDMQKISLRNLLNNCIDTDSYKGAHSLLLPPNTTEIVSYLESREGAKFPSTIFFGLQYLKEEYLSVPVSMPQVAAANQFFQAHGEPFPYEGWKRIVEVHNGYLPIQIDSVPEGTEVPISNMLMRVRSTDPEIPWAGGWIENQLVRLWYPITVATQSFYIKKMMLEFLEKTSDDPWGDIYFMLHDFGSRGVSSRESAAIGGMSHLVNFKGSDNIAGVVAANHYYDCPMAAFSIPASEHSTIILWGKNREKQAYQNLMDKYLQKGRIVSCVSDSYDLFNVVENMWAGEFLDRIKASEGRLVIRPDSGRPVEILEKIFHILERKVGMTTNSKGFKILPTYLRVIQGDGVNLNSIREILEMMVKNQWSVSNIVFGMGGALLQQLNRDTQRFAFKPCWATVDGESFEVFKDPATDPGKRSKAGNLDLVLKDGVLQTVCREEINLPSALIPQWNTGKDLCRYTLDQIRETSERNLRKDV